MRPFSERNKRALKFWVATIVLTATSLGVHAFQVAKFERACTSHLHRAAVANTIELASSELGVALKYLEDHDLTAGNTALFYETPADDLGFWYQNLKAAQGVLSHSKDASPLERTNVLLKLKESLTSPPMDISIYPNQRTWYGITGVIFAAFLVGFVWVLATLP